jgi:hypothetical protein
VDASLADDMVELAYQTLSVPTLDSPPSSPARANSTHYGVDDEASCAWQNSEYSGAEVRGAEANAEAHHRESGRTTEQTIDLAASPHHRDGEVLFAMLDQQRLGELGRRDARKWLRTLGWCLDDAGLDSMLNEAQAAGPCASSKSKFSARWTFAQLIQLAERYSDLCGPDPEAVHTALRSLSGLAESGAAASFVDRATLQANATRFEGEGGLTNQDFDDMLALCGIPLTAKTVRLESIVDGMIDTICHPKAQAIHDGYSRPWRPAPRWASPARQC